MPLFIGAQPSACAPLVKLAKEGIKSINGFIGSHSIAAGTMITKPSRLSEIHHWIKQNVVEFVDVEEDKILAGYKALAQRGIWVEPTSALAWGAYQARKSTLPEPVILIMSGAGYKHLS